MKQPYSTPNPTQPNCLQVVMFTKIQRFLTQRVPLFLAEQAERNLRKTSAVKIARYNSSSDHPSYSF